MLHLIPAVNGEAAFHEGTFVLPNAVVVDARFPTVNKVFAERLARFADYRFVPGNEPVIAYIKEELGEEAYRLEIKPEKVIVYASGEKGYSNGLTSLSILDIASFFACFHRFAHFLKERYANKVCI